jgi:hypothetical protein
MEYRLSITVPNTTIVHYNPVLLTNHGSSTFYKTLQYIALPEPNLQGECLTVNVKYRKLYSTEKAA